MNRMPKEVSRQTLKDGSEVDLGAHEPRTMSRREWFKASFGGSVGLAVGEFIDVPEIRAATQKLKHVSFRAVVVAHVGDTAGRGVLFARLRMNIDFPQLLSREKTVCGSTTANHAAAISRLTTEKRASRFSWKTGLHFTSILSLATAE